MRRYGLRRGAQPAMPAGLVNVRKGFLMNDFLVKKDEGWPPVNPCLACKGFMDDCPDDYECMTYRSYADEISGQRKLLEYLRDVALITPEAYQSPKSVIIKILKQLGENDGR